MAEWCPNCGSAVIDQKSLFCNKCGSRLPENPPGVVVSKAQRTAIIPAPSREVRGMRATQGAQRDAGSGYGTAGSSLKGILRFDTFITQRFLPVIYGIGALAITLVAVLSLMNPLSGTTSAKTADAAVSSAAATSLVFWILVLVAGNIAWRLFCEVAAATFRIHENFDHGETFDLTEPVTPGDSLETAPLETAPAQRVKCPHCSSIVMSDQLRECEYCGVTGCERCIRAVGLVRKHLSCRNCFESSR